MNFSPAEATTVLNTHEHDDYMSIYIAPYQCIAQLHHLEVYIQARPSRCLLYIGVIQVTLHPLSQWSDLQLSISHYLRRYKEEIGPLHLELSNNNSLNYLVKLHRALKFPRYNTMTV